MQTFSIEFETLQFFLEIAPEEIKMALKVLHDRGWNIRVCIEETKVFATDSVNQESVRQFLREHFASDSDWLEIKMTHPGYAAVWVNNLFHDPEQFRVESDLSNRLYFRKLFNWFENAVDDDHLCAYLSRRIKVLKENCTDQGLMKDEVLRWIKQADEVSWYHESVYIKYIRYIKFLNIESEPSEPIAPPKKLPLSLSVNTFAAPVAPPKKLPSENRSSPSLSVNPSTFRVCPTLSRPSGVPKTDLFPNPWRYQKQLPESNLEKIRRDQHEPIISSLDEPLAIKQQLKPAEPVNSALPHQDEKLVEIPQSSSLSPSVFSLADENGKPRKFGISQFQKTECKFSLSLAKVSKSLPAASSSSSDDRIPPSSSPPCSVATFHATMFMSPSLPSSPSPSPSPPPPQKTKSRKHGMCIIS